MSSDTASLSDNNDKGGAPAPNLAKYHGINLGAYVVNLLVTYVIGVTGIFKIPTTSYLSKKYQTILTPPGWAFGIWIAIFALEFCWISRQVICSKFLGNDTVTGDIKYRFALVTLFRCGWTICFSQEYIEASFLCMLGLAICLSNIVGLRSFHRFTGVSSYYFDKMPFILHFGWIVVALIVNLNVVLVKNDASTVTQFRAACGSLVLALAFAGLMVFRKLLLPPMVIVYALLALATKLMFNYDPKVYKVFSAQQISIVDKLAFLISGAIILMVTGQFFFIIYQFYKSIKQTSPTNNTASILKESIKKAALSGGEDSNYNNVKKNM